MNYIDELAIEIYRAANPGKKAEDLPLYRIYAVLLLAKGEAVTDADVHDAWAAWATEHDPDHHSIVEFYDLPKSIRAYDTPYKEAIHAVARRRWFMGRATPPAATE